MKKEQEKKKKFNEKLFDKLSEKIAKPTKRPKSTKIDPSFAEELNQLKAKKEAAEKERLAKIEKNKRLFDRSLKPEKKQKRKTNELDNDFLAEIKRLKEEKVKKKEESKKSPEKELTPAERLAKLKEEMERKRLESISSGKSNLDKKDISLLFSQKWWFL